MNIMTYLSQCLCIFSFSSTTFSCAGHSPLEQLEAPGPDAYILDFLLLLLAPLIHDRYVHEMFNMEKWG